MDWNLFGKQVSRIAISICFKHFTGQLLTRENLLHDEEFLAADFKNSSIRKSVKFHVLSGVNLAFDNLSILCNGLLMHFFVLYFIDF